MLLTLWHQESDKAQTALRHSYACGSVSVFGLGKQPNTIPATLDEEKPGS